MENKIPFYNILNMLLIGFVFCVFLSALYFSSLIYILNQLLAVKSEWLLMAFSIAITYEIGLIINRISSVIIEPMLKLFKLIYWIDYDKYIQAQRKDSFLIILSREYALSRNSFTMFIILTFIGLLSYHIDYAIITGMLSVLFLVSTRKHSLKIINRINI